jgi:hypothetical protein
MAKMETKTKKKVRQYRSRQGRSDKQYESTMKAMGYGCMLFLGILVIYGIYSAVTTIFI